MKGNCINNFLSKINIIDNYIIIFLQTDSWRRGWNGEWKYISRENFII